MPRWDLKSHWWGRGRTIEQSEGRGKTVWGVGSTSRKTTPAVRATEGEEKRLRRFPQKEKRAPCPPNQPHQGKEQIETCRCHETREQTNRGSSQTGKGKGPHSLMGRGLGGRGLVRIGSFKERRVKLPDLEGEKIGEELL